MQDRVLFKKILGLDEPWEVESYSFDVKEKRVDIFLRYPYGTSMLCPKCRSKVGKAFESSQEEVFRYLDLFEYRTFLHAKIPQMICQDCGLIEIHPPRRKINVRVTLLESADAVRGYLKSLYSIATRPIDKAVQSLGDEWNWLVRWLKSEREVDKKKEAISDESRFISSGLEVELDINRGLTKKPPRVYQPIGHSLETPGSRLDILSSAEQIQMITRLDEEKIKMDQKGAETSMLPEIDESAFRKTGTETAELPQIEKMESQFDIDEWKSKLGLDVEKVGLTVIFPRSVKLTSFNNVSKAFIDLYECVLSLIYGKGKKPESAYLKLEEKKMTAKNVCTIAYEGNARTIRELHEILKAKASGNEDTFLDIFVNYAEKNLEIDPEDFEKTLRALELFIDYVNQKHKFAGVILYSTFGMVEITRRSKT